MRQNTRTLRIFKCTARGADNLCLRASLCGLSKQDAFEQSFTCFPPILRRPPLPSLPQFKLRFQYNNTGFVLWIITAERVYFIFGVTSTDHRQRSCQTLLHADSLQSTWQTLPRARKITSTLSYSKTAGTLATLLTSIQQQSPRSRDFTK